MSKQLFYPVKYNTQPSKIDGKPYTTIIFEDVATGDDYLTYVYSKCVNKALWQDIIDNQDQDQLVFFDQLVIKDPRRRIIDADSKPSVLTREPKGELRAVVDHYRREEAAKNVPAPQTQPRLSKAKFNKLIKFKPTKPRPHLPPNLWDIPNEKNK